jgi:fatty acid desaturase
VPAPATRCAVVRSGRFFGLLFLNNNLHHTHHALPGAAWFRLPRLTREMGAEAIAADGAGLYRGYLEVFRRFAIRPFCQPVDPLAEHVGA